MSTLIQINDFPETAQLMAVVDAQFKKGVEAVYLVQGSEIKGTFLSRTAAHNAMARKVAEQWIANPDVIQDLSISLDEEAEPWE